jgi:DNA polymerase-3 subunit beta
LSEGNRIELVSGKSHSKIIGVSSDEYPSLPGIGIEAKGRVNAAELANMINDTLYAVSTEETRFNLNGVCFSSSKNGNENLLKLVATDGHRLAIVSRPVKSFQVKDPVIVPRKSLNEARKVLDEVGNLEVAVAIEEGFFVVDTGKTKISMRLVDSEFPDYKQVLPKDKGTTATVSSLELNQALKRVALMATDKNKCVRMDFSPGVLRISSSSSELGEATETLDVDYEGEVLSIGFNARYLSDFAHSLGEDKRMCIELHGVLGPGKFYAEGDESYFGIIMPMRLAV